MKDLDFDYDLWATKHWLPVLAQFPDPEPAKKVAVHLLFAQWVWLRRCVAATGARVSVPEEPLEPSLPAAELLHRSWTALLAQIPAEKTVDYANVSGDKFQNTLGEIATHVLNHGTYHRGHLRALAEAANLEFPETDFIRYIRE